MIIIIQKQRYSFAEIGLELKSNTQKKEI